MLRFDRLVVSCVDHRHLGGAAEDLGQQAVAVRRQVGDDDKGHAVSAGTALKNASSASTPPAEAPMPTIGR